MKRREMKMGQRGALRNDVASDRGVERRAFLQACGALAAMAALPTTASADRLERIGLQLFTVRDAMRSDFRGFTLSATRWAAVSFWPWRCGILTGCFPAR